MPVSAPLGAEFGWHLRTATSTGRKMAVASRAVMMAVRTQARRVEVKQGVLLMSVISIVVVTASLPSAGAVVDRNNVSADDESDVVRMASGGQVLPWS